MALNTVVNFESATSASPHFAVIRRNSSAVVPGAPIQDTSTNVSTVWRTDLSSFQPAGGTECANPTTQMFLAMTPGCGQSHRWFNLPDELHCSNQTYGVVVFTSSGASFDLVTTYGPNAVVTDPITGFSYQNTSGTDNTGLPLTDAAWTLTDLDTGYTFVGTTEHNTGDVDFDLEIKVCDCKVELGGSISLDATFLVDGEIANIPIVNLFRNSSAGAPVFTEYTANLGTSFNMSVDTTAMAIGDVVTLSIIGSLPISTAANAPTCKTLTKLCRFEVVAPNVASDPFRQSVTSQGTLIANELDGSYGSGSFGRCFEDILCVTDSYDLNNDTVFDGTFQEAIQFLVNQANNPVDPFQQSITTQGTIIANEGDGSYGTGSIGKCLEDTLCTTLSWDTDGNTINDANFTEAIQHVINNLPGQLDPFQQSVINQGVLVANEGDGSYGPGSFGRCFEDILCVTDSYDLNNDTVFDGTFQEAIQFLVNQANNPIDPFQQSILNQGSLVPNDGDGSYGPASIGRCLEDVLCVSLSYDTDGDTVNDANFRDAIQQLLNASAASSDPFQQSVLTQGAIVPNDGDGSYGPGSFGRCFEDTLCNTNSWDTNGDTVNDANFIQVIQHLVNNIPGDPFNNAINGNGTVAREGDNSYGSGSFGRCFEDLLCTGLSYDTDGNTVNDATFQTAMQYLIDNVGTGGGGGGADPWQTSVLNAGAVIANEPDGSYGAGSFGRCLEDIICVTTGYSDNGTAVDFPTAVQALLDRQTTITSNLSSQQIRDAMLLAPTNGTSVAVGSIDHCIGCSTGCSDDCRTKSCW